MVSGKPQQSRKKCKQTQIKIQYTVLANLAVELEQTTTTTTTTTKELL